MEPDEVEYELLMPFIVCASQGGPYDDEAFAAGFQLGRIYSDADAGAVMGVAPGPYTVPSACVAQVDLIAMKHGFTIARATDLDEPAGWTAVVLAWAREG